VNADWLSAPRLRTSCAPIGARGIKTWRAFGAPSHFLFVSGFGIINCIYIISKGGVVIRE